jgi:hypothetical protein
VEKKTPSRGPCATLSMLTGTYYRTSRSLHFPFWALADAPFLKPGLTGGSESEGWESGTSRHWTRTLQVVTVTTYDGLAIIRVLVVTIAPHRDGRTARLVGNLHKSQLLGPSRQRIEIPGPSMLRLPLTL